MSLSDSSQSVKTKPAEDDEVYDWRGKPKHVVEVEKKIEFTATWRDSDIVRNPKYKKKVTIIESDGVNTRESKRT